jgi:hypothetical protein
MEVLIKEFMERCLDCNSLLTKDEVVCVECGTKVGGEEMGVADMVAMIVSVLFYISAAALVTTPFLPRLPSFTVCMMSTCALLFVMRTAKESAQKLRKR